MAEETVRPVDHSVIQLVTQVVEIKTSLEHMSADMGEMRVDLKEIREGAPLHRITMLEARWRAAIAWLAALSLGVAGAIITEILTR